MPSSGAATTIGISDNSGAFMHAPEFQRLGLRTARLVVPWDGVFVDSWSIEDWLAEARRAGVEPVVTFEHSRGDQCPSAPCTLPSRAQFDAAFSAFHARFPEVQTFAAWNEPSHTTQPTARAPGHAAWFTSVIEQDCPSCTVITEVLLGSPGLDDWLAQYVGALGHLPQIWGVHAYRDVNDGTTAQIDDFLSRYQGRIWVTETGGIVRFSKDGRVIYAPDEQRAADAIDRAFDLVAARPRIERMYLYHWFGAQPQETWDSGLFDGKRARPAYGRLLARLTVAPSEVPADAPAPDHSLPIPVARDRPDERTASVALTAPSAAETTAPAAAVATVTVPGRWARGRGHAIRVALRCAGAAGQQCRVELGLVAGGRTVWRTVKLAANGRRRVLLAVPARSWRSARRHGRASAWVRLGREPAARRFHVRLVWR